MMFPLDTWDISLLLAVTAVVLLSASEMLSPRYSRINLRINRKRLRNVALTFAVLFLATLVLRIATMILNL